jgi:hypothetical protein
MPLTRNDYGQHTSETMCRQTSGGVSPSHSAPPGGLQGDSEALVADRPGPCPLSLESDRAELRTFPAVPFFP